MVPISSAKVGYSEPAMAQSVILVRLTLDWEDVGAAREYVEDMREALKDVPGFLGSGAWKGVRDPHARLILFMYESAEAARAGFVAIGDLPSLIERQHAGAEPADVKGLIVEREDGRFLDALPTELPVSFSFRNAEPGYGPEMVDEYEGIFGGLSMIPGYAGMLIGVNSKLTDEVSGFVAWKSEVAFSASMPENSFYEVTLYEPLGDA